METKAGYKSITNTFYKGYLGDFETEYWTEKDWEDHKKRVDEMKKDGTFGEPITITVMFKEIPLFTDNSQDNMGFEFKGMGFVIPKKDINIL